MGKTLVENISFVLQLVLLGLGFAMPKAQPQWIQNTFIFLASAASLCFTWSGQSIGPSALPFSPWYFAGILLLLAVAAPLAGTLERKRTPGDSRIFEPSRFWPHLISNTAGAVTVSAFIALGRSTPGFDEFADDYSGDAAFNIVLPMSVIVIFAFVRVQQLDRCPSLDQRIHSTDAKDWKDCIRGYSLSHWHQLLNTSYLIAATFSGATMILYLFGYSIRQAKTGHPVYYTWQVGMAICALLGFLFACAIPQFKLLWIQLAQTKPLNRLLVKFPKMLPSVAGTDLSGDQSGRRAVYLTFLTGTPATLVVGLIWFAILRESVGRDMAALFIIGLGYLLYTTLVVVSIAHENGEKPRLHYFSAAGFAGVLIVLAGALYYS